MLFLSAFLLPLAGMKAAITAAITATMQPISNPVLNPASVGMLAPPNEELFVASTAAITAEDTEVPIERITLLKLLEDAFSLAGTPLMMSVGMAPKARPVPMLPMQEVIISPTSEPVSIIASP